MSNPRPDNARSNTGRALPSLGLTYVLAEFRVIVPVAFENIAPEALGVNCRIAVQDVHTGDMFVLGVLRAGHEPFPGEDSSFRRPVPVQEARSAVVYPAVPYDAAGTATAQVDERRPRRKGTGVLLQEFGRTDQRRTVVAPRDPILSRFDPKKHLGHPLFVQEQHGCRNLDRALSARPQRGDGIPDIRSGHPYRGHKS
jgi:hypothetical protein